MKYVDVSEFAHLSGKTESYIRRLCRENEIPYIQEQLPQTNKLKYLIDLDNPEVNKHLNNKNEVPQQVNGNESQQVPQQNFTNYDIVEILEKFEGYILKAGKFELLEDKQKELKEDVANWQEKYFELKYRNEVLEQENLVLKQQLEKKSGFLGMFRK